TKENYISVLAAENMIGAIDRQDSGQLLMLLGEGEPGRDICAAGQRDFAVWFDREANNITLPGEGELVKKVDDGYARYGQLFTVMQERLKAGETDAARELYLGEIQPVFSSIRDDLQAIQRMNDEEFMAGNARSGAKARHAAFSVAAFAGSAVFFGVLFAVALSKAVVRPTVRLTETVRRIREDNLTETVDSDSWDELGTLAKEFNLMLLRLREYEKILHGRLAVEQQKALAIMRSMKDGVLLLDGNWRVVMLNPAAASILGIDAGTAVGEPVATLPFPPAIGRQIEKALGASGAAVKGTVAVKRDGSEYYYEIEAVSFGFAHEAGLAVILKDVTHFKVLEQKKAAFLAGVAHELRTPLTSISMGVGMLNESNGLLAESDKELLAIIREETGRLRGLVDDLLDLSRLDAGRRPLKLQQVNIRDLVERVVASFRLRAEACGVSLLTQVAGELPVAKWEDEKIQSVLANLIDNAFRYTGEGGTITLGAQSDGPVVRFSVTDNGPGIPVYLQERVFESFYQVEGRPAGKAGLGLTICAAIVKRHGGRIWVESEEGHGATFLVELPVEVKTN
ncbi:MAG TPA: ATP-binding protein, partial [Negativicutes bacterium]|nr:ATP-binding protein [Negativicutes bacterium]